MQDDGLDVATCASDLPVCLHTRVKPDLGSVAADEVPLIALGSFDRLRDEVHRLLGGYKANYAINFE